MEELQQKWKTLYAQRLPAMAKARDAAQSSWPVYLDHCMARIVLDNAVGKDSPWTGVVKSPAIKHMSEEQIRNAIELGNAIASGDADINELNERSLELRGKQGPRKRKAESRHKIEPKAEHVIKKQKIEDSDKPEKKPTHRESGNISTYFLPSPQRPGKAVQPAEVIEQIKTAANQDMDAQLKRIADAKMTPFRKQALSMLCQVPRGQYSTYQAMSDYISKTSHKTCARAVGSAMRNNPFAPEVPCHRILAADGTLGGFGGHWGEEGKFAKHKHDLLQEEGVKFDSRLRVKGPPFRDFQTVA